MSEVIICLSENTWYSLDICSNLFEEEIKLSSKKTYITFQVPDFIRYVKSKKNTWLPNIINLESLDKQFSQSGKDILGHSKWHILKALRRWEIINSEFKITQIESFLQLVKSFYEKLLINSQELNRFNTLEIDLNKIIHEIQLQGIRVDEVKVEQKCKKLHYYLYKLKNQLQFDYNIFQPENVGTQLQYLNKKKYKIINSCRRTISLLRNKDKVCKLFYEINRTSQDLNSLLFISARFGGKDLVHPYFIGFGSITSRIIIKEPSLQNLRKENRDIVIPNIGKRLLYLDYSQYEAGILSHFSEDKKLLELYNNEDVYGDIVKKIICKDLNDENRKDAKILFYRFLYGDDFTSNSKDKKIVESYFNSFTKLTNFKKELISESIKNGFVKSIDGNYRKLNVEGEDAWILSHYIQSVSSYIFKKSLIQVYKEVRNARLLIPLHDGALYEVDINHYDVIMEQIKTIFIDNLKVICPSLKNAKAEIQDFYKDK